jgi:hypothetical protein
MPTSPGPHVPDDVTDILLWRLAVDVAANHQPDRFGRCANLRCTAQAYPCQPAQDAARALCASRNTTPPRPPARGRARVAAARPASNEVSDWFQPNATPGASPAAQRWPLPRRQPMNALRAA